MRDHYFRRDGFDVLRGWDAETAISVTGVLADLVHHLLSPPPQPSPASQGRERFPPPQAGVG
jgi:hypothetical protein